MQNRKIRIIYFIGEGRSGSTLLSRALGQVNGLTNVGELLNDFYNNRQRALKVPCECGEQLDNCSVWKELYVEIPDTAREIHSKYMRMRYMPLLLTGILPQAIKNKITILKNDYEKTIKRFLETSECSFIVETSKQPAPVALLNEINGLQIYLIHLIRDPRAVVSSWKKSKRWVNKRNPIKAAILWSYFNSMAMLYKLKGIPYHRVLFEDFIENPKNIMTGILQFLNIKQDVSFIHGNEVKLNSGHTISGNPDKLLNGWIAIKKQPWHLSRSLQIITMIFTWPYYIMYYHLKRSQLNE